MTTTIKKGFAACAVLLTLLFSVIMGLLPPVEASAATISYSSNIPYLYGVTSYCQTTSNIKMGRKLSGAEYKNEPITLVRGEPTNITLSMILKNITQFSTIKITFSTVNYVGDTTVGSGAKSFFTKSLAYLGTITNITSTELRDSTIIYPASKWAPNFTSIKGSSSSGDVYNVTNNQNAFIFDVSDISGTLFTINVAEDAPGWSGEMWLWFYIDATLASDYFSTSSSYNSASSSYANRFYIYAPLVFAEPEPSVDYQSVIDELQATIAAMQRDYDDMVAYYEIMVSELRKAITVLEETVAAAELQIAAYEERILKLEDDLDNSYSQFCDLLSEKISLEELIADFDVALIGAEEAAEEYTAEIERLLGEKAELEAEIEYYQELLDSGIPDEYYEAQITELQQTVADLQGEIDTAQTALEELTALQALKADYEKQIAALTTQLLEKDSDIEDLKLNITTHENKITELHNTVEIAQTTQENYASLVAQYQAQISDENTESAFTIKVLQATLGGLFIAFLIYLIYDVKLHKKKRKAKR